MSDDPIRAASKALRVDLLARSDRLQDSLAEIHGDIAVNMGASPHISHYVGASGL